MPKINTPGFKHQIIHNRKDGYWIDKFYYHKNDKAPGLIVSGLKGEIEYLENPNREDSCLHEDDPNWVHVAQHDLSSEEESEDYIPPKEWKAYKITKLKDPVPTASMDITGNGYNDVIVAYNYGNTMIDSDPKGGDIIWLENPGDDPNKEWKAHFIGRWPTTHRLATGYFTQRTFPELIAAPVVHGPYDKLTPIPLICFQKPDDKVAKDVKEWRKDVVDDGHFRVVHEIYKKSLDGPLGLDSLLVASMDGVARLYYEEGRWKRENINPGAASTPWQRENSFFPAAGDLWGAGTADAGKIGNNPFAYVVSNEPFHGPYVSLYTRKERGQPGNPWKRHVLDVYGTPTQKRCWGDGPIHNVVCADIDGDGNDEFLVSMFGPVDRDAEGNTPDVDVTGKSPNKGIWCYKILDLDKGVVAKWHIAPGSSARCTVGNFMGAGKADLASLSYHVEKYYREKNPVVTLHHNLHLPPKSDLKIIGTLWGGEGMVYLPRPEELGASSRYLTKDLVNVANYAISVEVHAPCQEVRVAKNDGIKVLYGAVEENPSDNGASKVRRPLGGAPFPAKESLKSDGTTKLRTHKRLGAIILRLQQLEKEPGRWKHASDVPVETTFDLTEQGINFPPLNFIKVDKLWWGGEFQGYDFYNMTGFHFRLQDNKQNICHMQFWTAGAKVQAEYHNHNDNAFKELHTCLSQGTPGDDDTKLGGMWAPIPSTCDSIITESSISQLSIDTKTHPSEPPDVKHCGLKPLEEHGRIWHEDATGNAVYRTNNTVSYPAHQWAAGDGGIGKCLDVWMALEFDAWLDFNL